MPRLTDTLMLRYANSYLCALVWTKISNINFQVFNNVRVEVSKVFCLWVTFGRQAMPQEKRVYKIRLVCQHAT